MDTVNGIELTEPGAPSHILRDMSEYATLAFIASFDVPQVHRQGTKQPSMTVQAPATTMPQYKRITYIALAKMCMPKLAELFLQFKEKDEVFVDGTVEAVLSAYAVPIKLKYECPPPSKFGKDLPLWKTATTCFLKIVKEIGSQIDVLGSSMTIEDVYPYANANDDHVELSPVRVESTWRQVIDVYRGGILADWYVLRLEPAHQPPLMPMTSSDADSFSLSEQEDEENFDLSLVASLETDVIPCLGDERVPDYLITRLAKVLQQGSQLLLQELDDEYPPTPSSLTKPEKTKLDKADSERMGSTAPVRGVSRERFSYWCLDLLFLICSDTSKGRVYSPR
jgi:hypothetical protein